MVAKLPILKFYTIRFPKSRNSRKKSMQNYIYNTDRLNLELMTNVTIKTLFSRRANKLFFLMKLSLCNLGFVDETVLLPECMGHLVLIFTNTDAQLIASEAQSPCNCILYSHKCK